MPDRAPAVFLSYASQDAEAARRIAEALRAAGVEVWFDQSELVGGDAWDQKIRRQIKECALFMPIISANANARAEGYFRLEWRLAEQRTFLMAKGRSFLVPIVIDDTRDAEAYVPDSFLEVQWSRFPDGNCDARFAAHVQRLLNWDGCAAPHAAAPRSAPTAAPVQRKRRPALTLGAITAIVIGAGVAVWVTTRSRENATPPPPAAPSTPTLSEARQLVAKAWDLMNQPAMARTELEAGDNLCQQAAALDPNDADVWATWSQVDSWFVYHRLDWTPARQDGARTKAARALSLDPNSYEARLAQACYLVREGGGQSAVYDLGDARAELEALLREKPNEPRALWALGILLRNIGNVAGYRDAFTRMAQSPAFAVQAYNELGWAEFFNSNHREAEAAADASIALNPYWANLNLKTNLLAFWRGDLEKARATVDRISGTSRQEDYAVSTIILIDWFRRDPDAMLRVTNRLSRDWLESNAFDGPVAWWNGLARQMAGQADAAQLQWRTALTLVERRLADQPGSIDLLRWKARLLLASGNQTEGATAMRLAREMGGSAYFYDEASDDILLGDLDGAVTVLEQRAKAHELFLTAAYLRLSPEFDALRDLPRYRALLARLEADPRFSPNAKVADASSSSLSLSTPAPPAPDKSVAVLAFANLSDDKENEYFSDGISEELLNVLAKIPGLKVTARTSSFYFKNRDVPIPDIAKTLGVAYVVEGNVRNQGDRVRITAQLIKANDGFQVWTDQFDRDLKDIFAVQDEIAGLIAEQMKLKLGSAGAPRQSVNPEAYRLVLEGHHVWLQRTNEDLARAEALFQQALALDPIVECRMSCRSERIRATFWPLVYSNRQSPFANRQS